jgi:hypothetical protein
LILACGPAAIELLGVPIDPRFRDNVTMFIGLQAQLENAVAGPATMKEKARCFEEDKPFVFHTLWHFSEA